VKRLIWLSASAALLCGCWSQSTAVEVRSIAPEVPPDTGMDEAGTGNIESDGNLPPWPPGDLLPTSAARPGNTLRVPLAGGAVGLARQALPASPHDTEALFKLTIPVGAQTGPTGLAELSAWIISETPDPNANRASMRREIENLEGSLQIRLGAHHTSFEVTVPRNRWRRALEMTTRAIHATSPSVDQLSRIRTRLLHARRNELAVANIGNMLMVLSELGVPAERYLVEIEDRTAEDVSRFQESYYRTAGTVLAIWAPGSAAETVLAEASGPIATWAAAFSAPPPTRESAPAEGEGGVLWAPSESEGSVFAFSYPLPHPESPGGLEKLLLLECLTMDGVGGRLEQAMETPTALHRHVSGVSPARRVVMLGHGPSELAISSWKASQLALTSLANGLPGRQELDAAVARLRLSLLARYDDPRGWLDWATGHGALETDAGGISATLNRLAEDVLDLDLAPAIAELASRPSQLVVIGGRPPETSEFAIAPAPEFADPAGPAAPVDTQLQEEAANKYLALAVRALGGPDQLRRVDGLSAELERQTDQGVTTHEMVWFRDPDQLRRRRRVLATTIDTVIQPRQPYEQAGSRQIRLDQEESRLLLSRMYRHPVILLSRFTRGLVKFRLISTRRVDDREMAVLQMVDALERLRIMIDTESGLVRVVTTRERRLDLGEFVHVSERYSDYRPVDGIRAPFYRVTTVDDGDAEILTTWKQLEIGAPGARFLSGDGPASMPPKR